MLQELLQGQDGFLVSPPSHSVDDVSNYVPVGIPELCWIWHALFFFLFPLFQVKCEARSALNKPKNNHNNCKKVSNEEKPKVAIGEECRADEQAFLVALYKYMKERKTPIERIPYLGFKQSKYTCFHFWNIKATQILWIGGWKFLTQAYVEILYWGWYSVYTKSTNHSGQDFLPPDSFCYIVPFWGSCSEIFIGLNPLIMTGNRHVESFSFSVLSILSVCNAFLLR